jgi:sporulation protein YlmC with PRC-barrel domain
MDKTLLGSRTAKGGFANERGIVAKFNAWQTDKDAKIWLEVMGYDLGKLDKVTAIQIPTKIKKTDIEKYAISETEYEKFVKFKKSDIQIKLIIKIGEILKIENLSLKKANSNADFNQIDKRTVDSYKEMWNFDEELTFWLKLFSGEFLTKNYPNLFKNVILREEKRIFIDEMPKNGCGS